MKITRLKLTNFRKLKERNFEFQDSFNIIVGNNGSGKTSLLESIYITSSGKSFITNHLPNCISFNENYFFIESLYRKNNEDGTISFLLGKEKKELRLNGNKLKGFSEVIGRFPVLLLNYFLSEVVRGSPENRREYLNHTLIFTDKDYYKELLKYYSLLEKRNAHLKVKDPSIDFIKMISEEMVLLSQNIIKKRKSVLEKIQFKLPRVFSEISGEQFSVFVEYAPSKIDKLAEDKYILEDIARKRTLHGIHLDEISLKVNNTEAREFTSLGEAYSLGFALKFSEKELIYEEIGESPIMLIDDFFSDLDERRRENVLKILKGEQTFITATSTGFIPGNILSHSKVIII